MRRGADERAPHHVVVLGAAGLLGHVVVDTLVEAVDEVTGLLRRPTAELAWWPPYRDGNDRLRLIDGIDATDWPRLGRVLDELEPDTIVNCVGVTPRRPSASDAVEVIGVNSLLPHRLARWSAEAGCRLITISTDCVFGHEPGGFTEDDTTDASDLYGRSKALGEVRAGGALTLRTSFIGRELVGRTELLEWFLSNSGGTVAGYSDVWYSGVPVATVASVVRQLTTGHRHLHGLYHLATEPISKLELLRLANDAFDAGVTIVPDPTTTSHRTLDGSRLRRLLPIDPVDWTEALTALAEDHRYDLRPDARLAR